MSRTRDLRIASKLRDPDSFGRGLTVRLKSTRKAIAAWQAAPLFGTGLGTFLAGERRNESAKTEAQQIHNTALWLLTEFGAVGLAVFAGSFLALVWFLYRAMRRLEACNPRRADAIFAGLLVMVAWASASQVHELMYQRLPWFILGMCAAIAMTPQGPMPTAAGAETTRAMA